MRTNKISGTCTKSTPRSGLKSALRLLSCLLGVVALTACGPPGPRALLKGQQLIEQGKYEKAIPKLQQATQLMPTNAQAWNHLGLAYHGNHQLVPAIRAYHQALTLDNNLTPVRFNLGCAYLDHDELGKAIEQLTSFTFVQPNVADGWLKLATAQLRTNRLDAAERSFRVALESRTNSLEALNGLGLVQFQKRRYAEALNFFNLALAQNPKYGPALLNAAIAAQCLPGSKQTALQLYRRYLALTPPPADAQKIAAVANQLDAELNPPPAPPVRPAPVVAQTQAQPKTNIVAKTNVAVAPTNPPPVVVVVPSPRPTVVRTNPAATTAANSTAILPPATSNAFALSNLAAAPETKTHSPPPHRETPVEVTRLDNSFVVVPPQEIGNSVERSTPVPPPPPVIAPAETAVPASNSTNSESARNSAKQSKKGLWERINPFSSKPKTSSGTEIVSAAPVTPTVIVINSNPPPEAPPPEQPVVVRRYEYQFPAKGSPGNREEAQKYVLAGNAAHKAGRSAEAMANYKKAVQVDPASYEAYFNLALTAYGVGYWDETLSACERTLALRPESVDARYWFAAALREAKFPQDAAEQLLIVLQNHPDDARSHLSLAKLYAGQLNQPQLAREHYVKVLELSPRHPDAPKIRDWLAANPPK